MTAGVIADEDVSLCSGGRNEGCADGDGIREGRGPNSGGGRMRLAAGYGTRECTADPLRLVNDDAGAANIGDGTRRAILEVSPVVIRLELRREDRRGVGSIDLRCWREVDESVIGCDSSSSE